MLTRVCLKSLRILFANPNTAFSSSELDVELGFRSRVQTRAFVRADVSLKVSSEIDDGSDVRCGVLTEL